MLQLVPLSDKAQALVKDYVDKYVAPYITNIYVDSWGERSVGNYNILKKLLSSIYARTENTDTAVLDTLGKYIINLSDYFSDDEIATLLAEYPALAIYCYEHYLLFRSSNKYKPSIEDEIYYNYKRIHDLPPKSIVGLCLKMANCKPGSHIYLPFAGTCPFALYQPDCIYDTAEESKEDWAYSKILLSSQGIDANMECRDSLIRDNVDITNLAQKKYDYIFSFPLIEDWEDQYIPNTFLYLAQNALNDGGEMYCVLPEYLCFGKTWREFRKILLKGGGNTYSAIVIMLPSVFENSRTIMSLLCIKKDGKGIISLIDVTDKSFVSTKKGGDLFPNRFLNSDKVFETLAKQDKEHVWIGKSIDLPDDADVYPFRYLVGGFLPEPNDDGVLYKVYDLVSIVPFDENICSLVEQRNKIVHGEISDISEEEKHTILEKYNEIEKQKIPQIGMKELSTSYLNCDINRDKLPVPSKPYSISKPITSDCLLIGFDNGKFRVGRVHGVSENAPITLGFGVVAVQLKTNIITEDFLLRCIMSKYAEVQANCMGRAFDLKLQCCLVITVMIPKHISEQERLCKEDTRSSLDEADRQLLESNESFRRDMHMKKHAIGQTLFNLNNWMRTLQRARKEGNGIVDDNAVVGTNKRKVTDIYETLQAIIEELETKIDKFDSGYGMQSSKIYLIDFIEEYCRKPENQNTICQYEFDANGHRAQETIKDKDNNNEIVVEKGGALESVIFPEEGLNIIFNNIISNAINHGFENTENPNNKVKFEIKLEGETCVVEISNNGEPLLSNYNPEDVLTYGISSKEGKGHYGLGGAEVRDIMQEFDGDVEFISNPKDEFTVTYRLIFNNPNIINPNNYGKY